MYLSKYGVARHIYITVPKAGSANHAVSGDWTPAAGDVKISKDGGAAANVTNLPVAIAMGNSTLWDFSLTATEMEAAQIVVTVSDSATKAVDDTGFSIETYGNASAQHVFDLGTASTAQTGDAYAVVNNGTYGNSALKTIVDTKSSQTSVDDLPTNAELATALGTSDDAVLAAIAALNNLSSAGAQAAAAAALAVYETHAGVLAANVKRVNDVAVTGNGQSGTEWGPA